MIATNLYFAVRSVAPIFGVSIGNEADRSTWRIDFKAEATAQQRADAEGVKAAFDPAVKTAEEQRILDLKGDALAADLLDRLRAATPTQISGFVDNNVTDLASARVMFKRILLVLALVARD